MPAARRLQRDAGPPNRIVIPALIVGGLLLGSALAIEDAPRALLIATGLVIMTVPSVVDVDGWRIRFGMAWLALEQRRRSLDVPFPPRTPAGAERWLADTRTGHAGLARASALLTAGRPTEARAIVDAHSITSPEDEARVARMRAAIDGLETGTVDTTAARAAISRLAGVDRRYHELSLAWSIAWIAVQNGRPWRAEFARASRGVPIPDIPWRYRAWVALQELLLPVVGIFVVVVGWLVVRP
jgi:hypothetical protein